MNSHNDLTAEVSMDDRTVEETMTRFRAGLARMTAYPAEAEGIRALAAQADLDLLVGAETFKEPPGEGMLLKALATAELAYPETERYEADDARPIAGVPARRDKPFITPDYSVFLAAYYKASDPFLTQQAIGARAGLGTQAQVSRLLAEARSKGYLREVFEFPVDMPPDERRLLQRRLEQSLYNRHAHLEAALAQRAREMCRTRSDGGNPFKRLHVVAAPGWYEQDEKARMEAFGVFGANAAEIVASYVDEADSCSVAWGRTIDATVRRIRSRGKSAGSGKVFMPIAGEPTNYEPSGVNPSDAARILAAAWPGSEHLSLRGGPARIPKSVYEHDQNGIVREMASYSKNYRRIFRRPGGLIENVAMILTGIGDVTTSKRAGEQADPWYLETADAEGPEVLGLTVGNIGGVWIARNGPGESDTERVEQVNKRWLGAQHNDFRRCSLSGGESGRPGVVVLAVEPEKAAIVLEALYLVNVLVISRQLADTLARELLA